MRRILRRGAARRRDGEDGATAVEYGLLTAGIAAAIALVVITLGRQVQDGFCETSSGLNELVTTQASSDCS